MFIYRKNLEKGFSSHETHARSPRGRPTMGRTAEGRPELVELADDSVSSTDAKYHPALPTRSKANDREH